MKVHVVYDTQHGNTRLAAEKIAEGVRLEGGSVATFDVEGANPHAAAACDVLILGAPTHFGGPSRMMSRFIEELRKAGVDGVRGAVFATYMKGDRGKAVEKMEGKLAEKLGSKALGMKLILPGLSLDIGETEGPIPEAELARCLEFGRRAVAAMSVPPVPSA